jgi:hypothetical protein
MPSCRLLASPHLLAATVRTAPHPPCAPRLTGPSGLPAPAQASDAGGSHAANVPACVQSPGHSQMPQDRSEKWLNLKWRSEVALEWRGELKDAERDGEAHRASTMEVYLEALGRAAHGRMFRSPMLLAYLLPPRDHPFLPSTPCSTTYQRVRPSEYRIGGGVRSFNGAFGCTRLGRHNPRPDIEPNIYLRMPNIRRSYTQHSQRAVHAGENT